MRIGFVAKNFLVKYLQSIFYTLKMNNSLRMFVLNLQGKLYIRYILYKNQYLQII